MTSVSTIALNDGHRFPAIGLGTYGIRADAVSSGIEAGYRLIDTAYNYGNEQEVGRAVMASAVPRAELLVTTKLPGRHHGYDATIGSLTESLGNLGLDYADLYLIHWPNPARDQYLDSWRAMIQLQKDGLVRSIGVSNFTEAMLLRLIDETGVVPALNQVELHPHFPQEALRAFHTEHGIVTQSWSPLGRRAALMSLPVIRSIADAHGVTPTQAVLRWHVQLGALPIPRSADAARQAENIDIFDFELSANEMAAISALGSTRIGADPDAHEEL